MQNVSLGHNLREISEPVFWEGSGGGGGGAGEGTYFNMSSADFFFFTQNAKR